MAAVMWRHTVDLLWLDVCIRLSSFIGGIYSFWPSQHLESITNYIVCEFQVIWFSFR